MGRAFFDQVDDELRGFLGPLLRGYASERNGRLIKLWYAHPTVHFEAQLVGQRWSPTGGPAVEVGLHLEHPDARVNEDLLAGLLSADPWRAQLPAAGTGPALGPRGAQWRRVSEFLVETAPDDPDLASEVAERLADYVRVLWPVLRERAGELPQA